MILLPQKKTRNISCYGLPISKELQITLATTEEFKYEKRAGFVVK